MEGFLNVEGRWLKVMKKRYLVLDKINENEIYLTSYLGPLKKIKKKEYQITSDCEFLISNNNEKNLFQFQIHNLNNKNFKTVTIAADTVEKRNIWIAALNKCYYISNTKIKVMTKINNNLLNLSTKIIILQPISKTIATLFNVLKNVKIFKYTAFEFYERIVIFCNFIISLNEADWKVLYLDIQLFRFQSLLDQSIEIWNKYCDSNNFLLNAYLCDNIHIEICNLDRAITHIISNILVIFNSDRQCDAKLEYIEECNVSYLV